MHYVLRIALKENWVSYIGYFSLIIFYLFTFFFQIYLFFLLWKSGVSKHINLLLESDFRKTKNAIQLSIIFSEHHGKFSYIWAGTAVINHRIFRSMTIRFKISAFPNLFPLNIPNISQIICHIQMLLATELRVS